MSRAFLLVASLAISVGMSAQSQQPGVSYQAQPGAAVQPYMVMVPFNPYGYAVAGGYGSGAYLINLGTLPVQNTGISLADRAGISLQAPLQTGTLAFAPSMVPGTSIYGPTAVAAAAGYPSQEANVAQSGRLINDMGPSYYEKQLAVAPGPPPPSVAEVALYYRSRPKHNVRTFTSEDAHRLFNTVKLPVIPPAPTVP
jgi:hypothetical protein